MALSGLLRFPAQVEDSHLPMYSCLLAMQGASIIERVKLEGLSRDKVCLLAFIGASLKFRGADAAPICPVALPIHSPHAPGQEPIDDVFF